MVIIDIHVFACYSLFYFASILVHMTIISAFYCHNTGEVLISAVLPLFLYKKVRNPWSVLVLVDSSVTDPILFCFIFAR